MLASVLAHPRPHRPYSNTLRSVRQMVGEIKGPVDFWAGETSDTREELLDKFCDACSLNANDKTENT